MKIANVSFGAGLAGERGMHGELTTIVEGHGLDRPPLTTPPFNKLDLVGLFLTPKLPQGSCDLLGCLS